MQPKPHCGMAVPNIWNGKKDARPKVVALPCFAFLPEAVRGRRKGDCGNIFCFVHVPQSLLTRCTLLEILLESRAASQALEPVCTACVEYKRYLECSPPLHSAAKSHPVCFLGVGLLSFASGQHG